MPLNATPGAADADSYLTLAAFKAACDALGYAYAGVPDADLESALRRATRWLDGRYGARFPGRRTGGRDQPLEWPRTEAVDAAGFTIAANAIPTEVQRALVEAGWREARTPNGLAPDVALTQQKKRTKLGDLEVEFVEAKSASDATPVVQTIDAALAPLFGAGAAGPSGGVTVDLLRV